MRRAFLVAMLCVCGTALAQHDAGQPANATAAAKDSHSAQVHLPYNHPTLPADARWAGATTLLILGSFLAAVAVGVVVRLNAPDEVPVAHSHDEPPGASGHHGPGGTVQPGPEHDLPGGHAHHH